jgi:hypothetical protein
MAISAVTLAELSAGSHEVRPDTEQDAYFEAAERARRLDVLQRAEYEFDPIPFDADAARAYGRVTAAVIAVSRKPSRKAVDLMIAATAIVAELPLYTTNPRRFRGPKSSCFGGSGNQARSLERAPGCPVRTTSRTCGLARRRRAGT